MYLMKMVEYCEESGCRRKKVLESFGEQVWASGFYLSFCTEAAFGSLVDAQVILSVICEKQVPGSLCGKTCDACKHPNLVTKYLEELTTAGTFRNQSSRIFISRWFTFHIELHDIHVFDY